MVMQKRVALNVYIGALSAVLAAALVVALRHPSDFDHAVGYWLFLSVLFGATEYVSLFFHHESGRVGLSFAEAILLPMLVGLTFAQVVWGVALAHILVSFTQRRIPFQRRLFNIAELGASAAAVSALYSVLHDSAPGLSYRDATAAVVCIIVFAALTHALTAIAIALAGGGKFVAILKGVPSETILGLVGSLVLGVLFAAAHTAGSWTAVLFPLLLGALWFGYHAVIRQMSERERVEFLYSASRALAAGTDLEDSLRGFLDAAREIVSSQRMIAVVHVRDGWNWMGVRANGPGVVLQPLMQASLEGLLETLRSTKGHLLLTSDDSHYTEHLEELQTRNMVTVPIINDDEVVGMLAALGRIGADEFGDPEVKLLQALANELVLTLDSYRLFEEVKEERERFQRIFTGSKEGICLIDEGGVIRAWNPALARITGYDEGEVLGQRWADRIMVRDRNHQRIDGMGIVSVSPDEELEIVTKQGPARWVTTLSGQVQAAEEKSWVVLVRDITREHELEEAKSDFLSTVSHELRTPLTTIKGSLQVLSRPNADANSEMGKQMVAIMKRGSDRLERLVMNLLAVSQLEMGDVQVFPDEINMEELLKSRIDTVLPEHPQVELAIGEEIVVRADRERLAQVVEHLLDNARKFGGEEGMITIKVAKENGFAHVSVSDEGPGIAKIDHDRIFDRFVRLGHVLTRETQGPGVGLYIAKRSIEAMGGSISVESAPDQGAIFHVRVPLARPMAIAGADATA
jgi:PAS domain S-box-containing protein